MAESLQANCVFNRSISVEILEIPDQINDVENPSSKVPLHEEKETGHNSNRAQTLLIHYYQFILEYKKPNNWIHNKPDELFKHLIEGFVTLVKQPEAEPFLYPVDPVRFKDYYDIIKQPTDLLTIREKLLTGQYQSGWEFIDDMWLMFNNSWMYNKKSSREYKNCSKLSDLFKSLTDKPMKELGYCCGEYHIFDPRMFCNRKQNCIIPKFAAYWSCGRYQVCEQCYSEFQHIVVLENAEETKSINKEEFVAKVNNVFKKELFVECGVCKIKCHKICALHLEDMWKNGYICCSCSKYSRKNKVPIKYTSKKLPKTKLGSHIEDRVNSYLKSSGCKSEVTIRIVCQSKKVVDVKPSAFNRFVKTGIWPEQFPYTSKTLLAFQRYENMDVCFFAMFVQEYNSECPYPNKSHVYISYLDSVHYFTPRHLKTSVYHTILLGYLEYIKKLGFTTAHLWSCPSVKGEDYVFHCHPEDQQIITTKHLLLWYRKMLQKGTEEGIVKDYKDIYSYFKDNKLRCVSQLPYFEGDFWPSVLENEISELERNTKESNKENSAKSKETKKKLQKPSKNSNHYFSRDPLTDRMSKLLYKSREVFLVIELEQTSDLPVVADPDPSISSELMSSRDPFLLFCQENDLEFSSLRRARYSTMVFLYELHKEKFVTFFCNQCKQIKKEELHCNDFDLCSDCYNLNSHNREMEALKPATSSSFETQSFHRHLEYLNNHVSRCKRANCTSSSCKSLKKHIEYLCKNKAKSKHDQWVYVRDLVSKHCGQCKIFNCYICRRIVIIKRTVIKKC